MALFLLKSSGTSHVPEHGGRRLRDRMTVELGEARGHAGGRRRPDTCHSMATRQLNVRNRASVLRLLAMPVSKLLLTL